MAKFLGFLVFVLVATMGFGMLMFLSLIRGLLDNTCSCRKSKSEAMAYKMIGHKEEE